MLVSKGTVAAAAVPSADLRGGLANAPASPEPARNGGRRMNAQLSVAVEQHDDGATVKLGGELDLATAPVLARALAACRRSSRRVTLDLRGLEFMDCSGLRCILDADRRAQLTVIAGTGRVRQLLALTGVDRRLALVGAPLASRAA
jgi:anti-anti-sigma factor